MAIVQAETTKLLATTALEEIQNLNKDTADHKEVLTVKVVTKIDKITTITVIREVITEAVITIIVKVVIILTIIMVAITEIKVATITIDHREMDIITKAVIKTDVLKVVGLTETITLTDDLNKEKLQNNCW